MSDASRRHGRRAASPVASVDAILDGLPDAVVVVDAAGRITLVNRQAETLFAYSREDLLGRGVEDLVPVGGRSGHPEHRRRYMAHPAARPMGCGLELTARRSDGTEIPVDISLSAVETDAGRLVAATVRDITERRSMERALREARALRADRLENVGQLAGGIAHDFNNLLAVIVNNADFALRDLPEGSQVREDVEEVRKAAERAIRLTRQLLMFSRRDMSNPVVLDVNAAVSDVKTLLRRTLGEHVELRTHLAGTLPRVAIDPGRLEQVLVNLAINARDAMPGGGLLVIETDEVRVDSESTLQVRSEPGLYARITVGDTGSGMSDEVRARAFEPFFSTKARGQGTGLGLATVYGIVTDAGGTITLYSEPGRGSTVRVYLPVTGDGADVAARSEARSTDVEGTGRTVMLVEDEPAVREIAARILARRGFAVVPTGSPVEALSRLSNASFAVDVLLTDVVMPGMSGRELAEGALRARPDLRVVYMSGYPQDVVVHQGGVDARVTLLEKPFTADSLLAKVRDAFAGEDGPRA